jgi:hypothetical protein
MSGDYTHGDRSMRFDRIAHHAAQHPDARLGRRVPGLVGHPARHAARGATVERRIRPGTADQRLADDDRLMPRRRQALYHDWARATERSRAWAGTET